MKGKSIPRAYKLLSRYFVFNYRDRDCHTHIRPKRNAFLNHRCWKLLRAVLVDRDIGDFSIQIVLDSAGLRAHRNGNLIVQYRDSDLIVATSCLSSGSVIEHASKTYNNFKCGRNQDIDFSNVLSIRIRDLKSLL